MNILENAIPNIFAVTKEIKNVKRNLVLFPWLNKDFSGESLIFSSSSARKEEFRNYLRLSKHKSN